MDIILGYIMKFTLIMKFTQIHEIYVLILFQLVCSSAHTADYAVIAARTDIGH